jgi:putative two-component system response regulator
MNMETREGKILIVDDEASVQRMLMRIVERVGRPCMVSSNAEQARRMMKEGSFDLVLCDIRLPGESGIDFVSHIILTYPETAVIMVTGVEDPKMVEKALELGVYGYIVKPFKVSEIIINVSSALRRQRLEAESRFNRENLEHMVQSRTAKLQETLESIIKVIAQTVESRDPYTAGHQVRVAKLACALAEEMGCPTDQIIGIHMAGRIHDLGKISIPAEILSKPSRLTDIEFMLIKTHPQVGYDILKDIEFPWPVAEITYQHHERMDGSGYPRGLKGDEIIPEAKIVAVADVVEAMASHRPYRPAVGIDAASKEIIKNKGRFYDPDVADACSLLLGRKRFSFELE